MSEVDHATAPSASEIEQRRRTARAEVARLSLSVRAARREAELRERQAAEVENRACESEVLLQTSLEELIQERRLERRRELADLRADAERAAADAREQAGWGAALELKEALARATGPREAAARRTTEAQPHQALTPHPPLRLRVVGAEDVHEADAHPALAAPEPVVAPEPACGEIEPTSTVDGSSVPAPGVALPGSSTTLVPADDLRELVQAAVAVGLREAIEHAVATMHLVPALARPVVRDDRPVPDRVVERVDEPPFLRRLLYLDVLLPLVAALIVLVLFIAWVG